MRDLSSIIIHCSATKHAAASLGRDFIRSIHVDRNGWSDIGYHWIITRSGTIEQGRPIRRAGAHVRGFNRHSVGVCLMGGLDDGNHITAGFDKFNIAQQLSLVWLINQLREQFDIDADAVLGHRDMSPDADGDGIVTPDEWLKACPTFDVQAVMRDYYEGFLNWINMTGYEPIVVR